MDHERDRRVFEGTRVQQVDLAAQLFLGRSPQDGQLDSEFVDQPGEGGRSSEGGRGDQIVSTRMTDAGQGVIFGAHHDARSGGSERELERRL